MAIAETLRAKQAEVREKVAKKSMAQFDSEKKPEETIDFAGWLLLYLVSAFVDVVFIIITLIGLIPLIGYAFYIIADPVFDILVTFSFWFYLNHKGLGQYWWLAFGMGLAEGVPILNWFAWTFGVLILYFLVQAQKVPLVGKAAVQKATKLTAVIK